MKIEFKMCNHRLLAWYNHILFGLTTEAAVHGKIKLVRLLMCKFEKEHTRPHGKSGASRGSFILIGHGLGLTN